MKTKVKEIFTSIQGEGPYIGYKQVFVRFCGCNLSCKYCDTEFDSDDAKEYSAKELAEIINLNNDCHSVSLTGGEPLLNIEFLKELLPLIKLPVYLETNATLSSNLKEIINYIDFIAADIKLPSCTGVKGLLEKHDKFFENSKGKNVFAKIVFDSNITEEEINSACRLGRKYDIELILQPKMNGTTSVIDKDFMEQTLNLFLSQYKNVRLIPQVHKFLNIR